MKKKEKKKKQKQWTVEMELDDNYKHMCVSEWGKGKCHQHIPKIMICVQRKGTLKKKNPIKSFKKNEINEMK